MITLSISRDDALDVVNRLRHVLMHVDLDCKCQASLAGALDRFAALEERRLARRHLARAREYRDRIAGILTLLAELDELTEIEPDRTVFMDIALLFSDIAGSAAAGATELRAINPNSGRSSD